MDAVAEERKEQKRTNEGMKPSTDDEYLKYSLPSHILHGTRTYQNEECEIVFGKENERERERTYH